MTPIADTTACAPPPIEASVGISESDWCRVVIPDSALGLGTVFGCELSATSREAKRLELHPSNAQSRLEGILSLAPGWDSYGAPKISLRAVHLAQVLLLLTGTASTASIVPTSIGGVQLEWHTKDVDLEIECLPSGDARLFGEDRKTGASEERWVDVWHPAIDDWVKRLGPRS